MNELRHACETLCRELELETPAPDARGFYQVQVGDIILRLGPSGNREAVLEGVIVALGIDVASRWETQQDLLRQVLTWNLARLKGQARPEVLSFDEEENLLLLWRAWPCDARLASNVLRGAEEMLNEAEFWRGRILALAPAYGQN